MSHEEKTVEEASRALEALQRAETEFNRATDAVRRDLCRRVITLVGDKALTVKRISFMSHGVVGVTERNNDR
jgi:hypothetical protein